MLYLRTLVKLSQQKKPQNKESKKMKKFISSILFFLAFYLIAGEDHISNPLNNNHPQYKGTAFVSLAVEVDVDNVTNHIGVVISGYGHAAGHVARCGTSCCSGETQITLFDTFPPVLNTFILSGQRKIEGDDIVVERPKLEEKDLIRRNAITNHTIDNAENGIWVIGFDLNPSQNAGCFCAQGDVQIWEYADIITKFKGIEKKVIDRKSGEEKKKKYHYELRAITPILYEDARKLIDRGLDMYLDSVNGTICYDATWRNCGSFAMELIRKANVPVPRIGSYLNLICPIPCPCSIQSCIRKTKIGSNNYKNEHRLLKRKGGEGLTYKNRFLRFFVFGFDS